MARYIDADELKKKSRCIKIGENGRRSALLENWVVSELDINAAPTADVAPVRHSEWDECDYKTIEHGFIETFPNEGIYCSICRTAFKKSNLWIKKYCPNCGAKMD